MKQGRKKMSHIFVFYMAMIMYLTLICVLFLHVSWTLFAVSPAAVMIAIVQQVVK